ncbi:MAG: ABC transporter substrate-binding protein [Spirochaetaceae bacterium]|nr:MAG: ABC transporter substrate-binding protein [Spirochaetaceae bacterium]
MEAGVFSTPDLLVSQVLSGSIDVAALPTNLASVLYNREAELQLAGVIGTGVLYLVADTPLDWDDLRGRTVYTFARGATPDILFRALATEAGLVPGIDFQLEYAADQVELAQSLIAGRRTLAVLPEPFVTRVTETSPNLQPALNLQREWTRFFGAEAVAADGVEAAEANRDDGAPAEGYPMTSLVVTKRFANEHPAGLSALIDRYRQGLAAYAADPSATSAVAASLDLGLDAETIQAALPRLNMTWIPAAEARHSVEIFLEVLAHENPASIGGRLPAADFFLSGSE